MGTKLEWIKFCAKDELRVGMLGRIWAALVIFRVEHKTCRDKKHNNNYINKINSSWFMSVSQNGHKDVNNSYN